MMKAISNENTSANWDYLIQMHSALFDNAPSSEEQMVMALQSGKTNIEIDPDLRMRRFSDLIRACRLATIYSRSSQASMILRRFYVDPSVDTLVSDSAQELYRAAEKLFQQEDFDGARDGYRKAVNAAPEYYKATLYLGDTYYMQASMDSAIVYFQKASDMQPMLIEPRKYIFDALQYQEKHSEAVDVAIDALCIFPDETLYSKLYSSMDRTGRKLNRQWVMRRVGPARVGDELPVSSDPVWRVYQEAKAEIEQYCNEEGMVTEKNDLTDHKYMEIYCWEKMLKSTSNLPPNLQYAKLMMDEGFLDCYVFFSVFHIDIYDQYKDFVKGNRERIDAYFDKFMIQ